MVVTTMKNKALEFCNIAVKQDTTPKYVKLQMLEFIDITSGKNNKYTINEVKLKQVNNILKLLVIPKVLKAGQTI